LGVEDVPDGLVAGLALVVALGSGQRLADVAVALADAAGVLLAVAELWNLDLRQRDADEVAALLPDQLAAADVLAEVALHFAADDPAEALMIAVDLLAHGGFLIAQDPRTRARGSRCQRGLVEDAPRRTLETLM